MSTHKYMDRICAAATVFCLLLTVITINGQALGPQSAGKTIGYENRLFDTSRVHSIEIVMDDWDSFIETCESEEYSECNVVIDGESYKNVGIRAKGNTSLSSVAAMGSSRYSFKIEFDKYDSTKSYHGLDKLSLNNLIQDNTMLKDYLTYRLMNAFGVQSSLSSFVYITVNGQDWGLYLAVEGVEEAFLQRNYGGGYGQLYKPDSMDFGGGRGNGQGFDMSGFENPFDGQEEKAASGQAGRQQPPDMPASNDMPAGDGDVSGFDPSAMFGGAGFGSSSDVKLQYIDDDPDSYSNIFSSAKTIVSDADKAKLIESLKSLSKYEDLENVLDIEAVLRYFVVHNFVVNGDSYTGSMIHNYYLYEEDGRLSMIPWDYNLAFGTFSGGGSGGAAGTATGAINDAIDDVLSDRPMQAWIFSDESYTQQYHELFAQFLNTAEIDQIIDQAYGLIAEYVQKDPTKFCTYEEFEVGVQTLRTFCALRQESIERQLAGDIPSTSEQQKGQQDALVNGDSVNLSDMGTMNSAGMGPGGREDRTSSAIQNGEALDQSESSQGEPSGQAEGGAPPFGEQMGGGGFSPPGGDFESAGEQAPKSTQQSAVILLILSAAVLLVGLLVAYKYKN